MRMIAVLNVQIQRERGWGVMRATFLAEEEGGGGEANTVPDFESCGAVWVSVRACTRTQTHQP